MEGNTNTREISVFYTPSLVLFSSYFSGKDTMKNNENISLDAFRIQLYT
ncbi:hypothetical protein H0R92_09055 [Treponema sp. OMZ 840]